MTPYAFFELCCVRVAVSFWLGDKNNVNEGAFKCCEISLWANEYVSMEAQVSFFSQEKELLCQHCRIGGTFSRHRVFNVEDIS